jgi:hypothetical protein
VGAGKRRGDVGKCHFGSPRIEYGFIHPLARQISTPRTIPDDSKSHAVPTDLGQLPLRSVDDLAETAPTSWVRKGGVVMPLAKGEAPWIWFSSSCRFAIKIGFGDCDVLSSAAWGPTLERFSRNYLVIPEPSLDEEGEVVRQLINMPCENIHFEAIQLQITPARAESYYRHEGGFVPRTIEDFFMRLIFGPMI